MVQCIRNQVVVIEIAFAVDARETLQPIFLDTGTKIKIKDSLFGHLIEAAEIGHVQTRVF